MTRLKTLRAAGPAGALLSTTILAAAVPSNAISDTSAPPTVAPATAAAPAAHKTDSRLSIRSVRRTVLAGQRVVVRGALRPAGSGRAVALEVGKTRGGWTVVDHDRTDRHGRYRLAWRANHTGNKRVRVDFGGNRALGSAHRLAGTTHIYRRAFASWYGPGLYGQHLACGGTLSTGTLGVAHKTLPCGTKVTLHYRGRTVRVPVVDRGPYVGGRDFDLTAATKAKLGFGSTGTVLSTR
jgi:rare lipoprotein A